MDKRIFCLNLENVADIDDEDLVVVLKENEDQGLCFDRNTFIEYLKSNKSKRWGKCGLDFDYDHGNPEDECEQYYIFPNDFDFELHDHDQINQLLSEDSNIWKVNSSRINENAELIPKLYSLLRKNKFSQAKKILDTYYVPINDRILMYITDDEGNEEKESITLLNLVSKYGNANGVKFLLDYYADPTIDDGSHIPPLVNAINNGRIKNALVLLSDERVDPSVDDNQAIRSAISGGHTEVVRLLLNDERVDPSDSDNQAIIRASERGYTEIVRLLLEDERVDPGTRNNWAIESASENGHTEVVRLLLTDPRVDPSDSDNETIKSALNRGHMDIVRLLLTDHRTHGFRSSKLRQLIRKSLWQRRTLQSHPLMNEDILDMILDFNIVRCDEHGCQYSVQQPVVIGDYDEFMFAVRNGNLADVDMLMEGVDPSSNDNEAIKVALENEDLDMVDLLLNDPRVDPSVDDNAAIMTAAENGHTELVNRLLNNYSRVDPSASDNYPIRAASREGYVDTVRRLLDDPRVDPSAWGNYALTRASEEGHIDVVRLLLANGVTDNAEGEALEAAAENDHDDIVRLFLYGEDYVDLYRD